MEASVEEALRNAGAYMKEALVEAVKLEGGQRSAAAVDAAA
jgi:ketopantoate hydroxymethyltransferase